MKEGIDQGPFLMARADVDDHPGGFVDHKKVGILVQDLDRDVLGACAGGKFRRLLLDAEEVSLPDLVVVADLLTPQGHPSRLHKGLDFGAGEMGKVTDKDHVEPLTRILCGGGDFVDGGVGHFVFFGPSAADRLKNGDSLG